ICIKAPLTRPVAGIGSDKPPAGSVAPRISTRSMSDPSKSGCASWWLMPAANSAPSNCPRNGREWRKKPHPVARPKLRRCAAVLLREEQVLGGRHDKLVIVDGKTLRHAHVELVSAVDGSGRWLGTVPVKEGSNEIPAARELLGKVPVDNKTALADALHTQI